MPFRLLQQPSSFSEEEGVWVWDVTPDHQLFLDLENQLRFRVEEVRFREASNTSSRASKRAQQLYDQQFPSNTPNGVASTTPGGASSSGPTPKRSSTPVNVGMSTERISDGRPMDPKTPGSKATPAGATPPQIAPPQSPAMSIVASVDRAGLGLTSWWPPEDLEGNDEEDEAQMEQ